MESIGVDIANFDLMDLISEDDIEQNINPTFESEIITNQSVPIEPCIRFLESAKKKGKTYYYKVKLGIF